MEWGFLLWITGMAVCLLLMGFAADYAQSIERGWKPIIDFPKVWEKVKNLFKRNT